jgi:GT2 family glycosyltransferase/spore maturation protein CgeB
MKETRTASYPVTGPLVSVVILTRDGSTHLQRLFRGLDRTSYRSFEVLVVDNASSDDTSAVLRAGWSFPLRHLRNETNVSFSEGNNQGVAASRGDFVLLLNNDVEPINEDWMGAMVTESCREPEPAAVGALLVYPEVGDVAPDLVVQHRGVGFSLKRGTPLPSNLRGGDPADAALRETRVVPAATGAALMVRRTVYEAAGGCDPGYFYGLEDVDLCLRLREYGPVVVAGQAALFHHERATVSRMGKVDTQAKRLANWRRFAEVWAPRLSRSVREDVLEGRGFWNGGRERTVAITLTADAESEGRGDYYTAHGLGGALAAAGWKVLYAERRGRQWYKLPDHVDLVISLLDGYDVREAPKGAFTIAWVRNWIDRWLARPWFDEFDLVVVSSDKGADLIADATGLRPPVLPLAVDPAVFHPGPPNPALSADFVFTGNRWGVERRLVSLLDLRPDERFLLFGKNWDQEPDVSRWWQGHVSQDVLAEVYRSTKIVLDDTVMPREQGLVNARVFEALASGALVISDNVEGARELFDGRLPSYRDRAELRGQLDRFLTDDADRARLAEELRVRVVERHTYARRAREFVDLALEVVGRPRVAVQTSVPSSPQAELWGDVHFGRSLARALRSCGFASKVHVLAKPRDFSADSADVMLCLRGLTRHGPRHDRVNVLWIISHPDRVTPQECAEYDLVFCASRPKTEALREEGIQALFLPQATDGRRFGRAEPDQRLATDVLFVGNTRGQSRPAVEWALEQGLPITVVGSGWEGRLPDGVLAASYFPNEELGNLYASAGVVLNDHWPDMARAEVVSNRIFDVLASGGVVVSDRNDGIDELLPGVVPTFSSAVELREIVERLLAHEGERAALAARGRAAVLAKHSLDHRAETIAPLLGSLLEGRSSDCDRAVFSRETEEVEAAPNSG